MANITEYLNRIKSAVLGKDVRDSIHDAIEAINDEVEEAPVVDIVQTTGSSTTSIMSQKAVTDNLSSKADLVNGRIPYSQLPESAMEFKGTWNANTNTPTLVNGTGDIGDFYIVSVAGESLGQTFKINDRVVYDGSLWVKLSGGEVTSVNGKTGAVSLDTDDISDTNKNHKFVSSEQITAWNNKSNFSGSYNDLSDKPNIPTRLSELGDDANHRTVTDAQIQNWNNGTGGGGGDMYAATYDPQSAVADAGGIPDYVSAQITSAITNAIGGGY